MTENMTNTEIENKCICAYNVDGHEQGANGCLFTDGERRHWLCLECRKPADVAYRTTKEWRGYYGSAPAYENVTEAWTECCGAEFCLPNGEEGELDV